MPLVRSIINVRKKGKWFHSLFPGCKVIMQLIYSLFEAVPHRTLYSQNKRQSNIEGTILYYLLSFYIFFSGLIYNKQIR